DHERKNVSAYAVFSGTHSGDGGPVPPTGKSTSTDYVYVMEFENGKISHMTKIWNAGWAMRELGWTGEFTLRHLTTSPAIGSVRGLVRFRRAVIPAGRGRPMATEGGLPC